MVRRVAIQMDPVASLNPRAIRVCCWDAKPQKRGYELYYYTPEQLTYREGKITAAAQRLTLFADPNHFFEVGESLTLDLKTVDVVLLRQDPPFNMAYITSTHILEMLLPDTLVVNHPASVREHPEKIFPLQFAPFMPPTMITADIAAIEEFREQHHDIIVKPLYGYGGRSVFRLRPGDENLGALMDLHLSVSKEPLMVQAFLPDVKTGDRRIVLIDGHVAGIMGRIPAEHEIRANFRNGGSPAKAEMTVRQREICEAVGPVLRKKGLILAGLDVIGDYLTEINLTSPTGLMQINRLYERHLEAEVWDAIEARLHAQ